MSLVSGRIIPDICLDADPTIWIQSIAKDPSAKFSIAAQRSSYKRVYKFELCQLGRLGRLECFTDVSNVRKCSITYDASKKIDIPVPLLMWMYHIVGNVGQAFTLPIQNNFQKTCEITIKCNRKPSTPPVLHYFPFLSDVVPMFRSTEVFPVEFEQLIEIRGEKSDKAILVFRNCEISTYDVKAGENIDTLVAKSFELEIDFPKSEKVQFFLERRDSHYETGSVQVFSYEEHNLEVKTSSKREVVFSFDTKPEYETGVDHLATTTSLPKWKGQKVVYHWSLAQNRSDHFALMDKARFFTHLQLPRMLNPVQKAQMACILGMSVESLDRLMFGEFSATSDATITIAVTQ